jgi:hypothetical protein
MIRPAMVPVGALRVKHGWIIATTAVVVATTIGGGIAARASGRADRSVAALAVYERGLDRLDALTACSSVRETFRSA